MRPPVLWLGLGLLAAACSRTPKETPPVSAAPPPPGFAPPRLIVGITVDWPEHSAVDVEAEVAAPIEDALAALSDVRSMRSESRQGRAWLRVTMRDGVDAQIGTVAVRDALTGVLARLPRDLAPPIVTLPGSEAPLLHYVLEATHGTVPHAEAEAVRTRLAQVSGVASVEDCGAEVLELRVTVDAQRLAAHDVRLVDLVAALQSPLPPARPPSLESLARLELPATRDGVRLADVATLELVPAPPLCLALGAGGPVVLGEIRAQQRANRDVVRQAVQGALGEIEHGPGLTIAFLDQPMAKLGVDASARLAEPDVRRAAEELRRVVGDAAPRALVLWRAGRPERLELLAAGATDLEPGLARLAASNGGASVRILGGAPDDLTLEVEGPSRPDLLGAARDLAQAALGPGVAATGVDGLDDESRLDVRLDRPRLAALGVPPAEAQLALRAAWVGAPAGRQGDMPVRVRLGAPRDDDRWLETPLATGAGPVPLATVVSVQRTTTPVQILRVDRQRRAVVWLRLAAGVDAAARAALRARIEAVRLPAGVRMVSSY